MNPKILNKEVQTFLDEHRDSDLDRLIFKGSPFENITVQELAEQIKSRRKCRYKLPNWYDTPRILFPSSVNIEQSSSEKAAQYKASLIHGKTMIDLTGGFGVDSFYFSRKFDRIVHMETDRELHKIVKHNLEVMNVENVDCIFGDSMEFLKSTDERFDWIYVDPSRRGDGNERVFRLEDCSPNLTENLDLMMSKADRILVKLAPFLDISMASKELKNVEEIHVLAIDKEVKELLFLINCSKAVPTRLKAVHMIQDKVEFLAEDPSVTNEIVYGPIGGFLYEPNAAIRKAGLYPALAAHYNLKKIHPNSHLFTGDKRIEFPGRTFRVQKQIKYAPKRLKKQLGLSRANITTRNFHDSVALIRKRTGIKEGGDDYLFFTTDYQAKPIVIHCIKVEGPNAKEGIGQS